ncbi:MAG: imidazole glycerol phosphate synthase subunit HisF [Elusimicrobia bacterium]|nr:imidazole glycerol phosphate synthase subunit HisF [Elusimicrobiota bacterium]
MIRIIPRLDIKGPNLVKGIRLEGLRVLGKPERFARHYYEQGADELLYMDIVASLYQRNNILDIVARTAKEVFIPLTVGGGIRTLEDIRRVLQAGADKVAINTGAIRRPDFIREAAERFGSSTIVVSIEAIKEPDGAYHAYTDNGRESTGFDAYEWSLRAASLGAGELMITPIDREGTGEGFDCHLTRRIAEAVSIPVIACGGAGKLEHIGRVINEGLADAVCLASMLHYEFLNHYDRQQDDFSGEGNTEHLKEGRGFLRISEAGLPAIKNYLLERHVTCRPLEKELTHAG